jgi:hypothetical protein
MRARESAACLAAVSSTLSSLPDLFEADQNAF